MAEFPEEVGHDRMCARKNLIYSNLLILAILCKVWYAKVAAHGMRAAIKIMLTSVFSEYFLLVESEYGAQDLNHFIIRCKIWAKRILTSTRPDKMHGQSMGIADSAYMTIARDDVLPPLLNSIQ